jgi:hypothetical protein
MCSSFVNADVKDKYITDRFAAVPLAETGTMPSSRTVPSDMVHRTVPDFMRKPVWLERILDRFA